MTHADHRRTRKVLTILVLGLGLLGACGEPYTPTPDMGYTTPSSASSSATTAASGEDLEAYAAELLTLTNEVRAEEGLDALVDSACAQDAALSRAQALVGQEELEHGPLGPVIESCAPLTTAAENLVNSTAPPAEVVEAWLGSPGHRANIIDPELTELGIGCVPDGAQLLCAQIFLGP